MRIRKATIEDLKDIQRLDGLLDKESYKLDKTTNIKWSVSKEAVKYYKKAIKNSRFLVLLSKKESKIIGYLVAEKKKDPGWRKDVKLTYLEGIFIEKPYRNKGIGQKMLFELTKWAKKENSNRIQLDALTKNKRAIKFYNKLGFFDYEILLEKKI